MTCNCGKNLTEQEIYDEKTLAYCVEWELVYNGEWEYKCRACRRQEQQKQRDDDIRSYTLGHGCG